MRVGGGAGRQTNEISLPYLKVLCRLANRQLVRAFCVDGDQFGVSNSLIQSSLEATRMQTHQTVTALGCFSRLPQFSVAHTFRHKRSDKVNVNVSLCLIN
jgi:hypothetical protein